MKEVKIRVEKIHIPTYDIGKADKNPMFLNKRVYQASSGKVYPYPFIEKVSDNKKDREYEVVFLENEYISLMMMPELGGRIQVGYDKTNEYNFFYKNNVIKPALVGLAGPWISGGVEFNWPQHHRPSTFQKVEYTIEEGNDGSKTLWMGEIEMMSRMVGQVGIKLYPEKAFVEVEGRVYNRYSLAQNFLWWANIAVHVHDNYESFFPTDVFYVADHGKRDMSSYPYSDTVYYNVDYPSLDLENRNITKYSNIPVPMSYMALSSEYDFFGGYDYKKEAGTIHFADHHVSPGKKQWTWGCGDFGIAWDRQLTDEDGPYAELMAGVYTDNQPDFTWINPYETKTFKQYWYPFKKIGKVKNANLRATVNLEYKDGKIFYGVYTPENLNGKYQIFYKDELLKKENISITPKDYITGEINKNLNSLEGLNIKVLDENEKEIISFTYKKFDNSNRAKSAIEAPLAKDVKTNDELYLIGIHLEQYRHATYNPEDYYLEGLKRDENDSRCNVAYGKLLIKKGDFKESISYFKKAIDSITKYNPNPITCDAYYYLGIAYNYLGKTKEAYDAFFKAIWDDKYKNSAWFKIAQIDSQKGDYHLALEHVENSIKYGVENIKARNLKISLLRKLNKNEKALNFINETLKIDKLAYIARYELSIIKQDLKLKEDFLNMIFDNPKTYIELSMDYGEAGLYDDAILLLNILIQRKSKEIYPMVYYYLGNYEFKNGSKENAILAYEHAMKMPSDYCFPHRLESIEVLKNAIFLNPKDSKAPYYLGNLLYDKKKYQEAIKYWEISVNIDPNFATVHRNLGISYFNILKDLYKSKLSYENAFELDKNDARVFFELDQLYKILNIDKNIRLSLLEKYINLVEERDDLYIEKVKLHNELGESKKALNLLNKRNFHPWEGGEGKVSEQYIFSNIEIAKSFIEEKNYEEAINCLKNAKKFPKNLGEGKIYGSPEADINFYLGKCYDLLSDEANKIKYYSLSANEKVETSSNLSYKPEKVQMKYYQGLSLINLGNDLKAKETFKEMIEYAKNKIKIDAKIDYFAISLPEFLIFEQDLNKINQTHCFYILGLGYLGLKEKNKALEYFKKSLELDINKQEVISILKSIKKEKGSE